VVLAATRRWAPGEEAAFFTGAALAMDDGWTAR
jgi:hypothetical protein